MERRPETGGEGQRMAEYNTFRSELQNIITVRYSIFMSLTMIYGLLFAFIGTSLANSLVVVLPLLLLALTFPVLLIDHYLTAHRRRLDSFLEVLEETSLKDFVFYRFYPVTREVEKEKAGSRWPGSIRRLTVQPVYTVPLLYAYLSLVILGGVVSGTIGAAWANSNVTVELLVYLAVTTSIIVWTHQTHELKDVKKAWRFLLQSHGGGSTPQVVVVLGIDGLLSKFLSTEDFDECEGDLESIVYEPLALLSPPSFRIAVVTNQPALHGGRATEARLKLMKDKLVWAARRAGVDETSFVLDAIYVCPHTDAENCQCHKPKTELLHRAVRQFVGDSTSARVYLIGDQWADIQAGHDLGKERQIAALKTVMQDSKWCAEPAKEPGMRRDTPRPASFARSLIGATYWIREQEP